MKNIHIFSFVIKAMFSIPRLLIVSITLIKILTLVSFGVEKITLLFFLLFNFSLIISDNSLSFTSLLLILIIPFSESSIMIGKSDLFISLFSHTSSSFLGLSSFARVRCTRSIRCS